MATTIPASQSPTTTTPPGQQKLETIMEAASALTALNEDGNPSSSSENETAGSSATTSSSTAEKEDKDTTPKKRYIPEHKKPDAALTFPEKLMNLMKYAEDQEEPAFCIAWLPDGKSFVIRNPDDFTRQVLPKFFKATKFSSFTRKLYRWGFRQVNRGIGPDDPIIFGNEHFQRDNAEEMSKMRSITAASSRKAEAQTIYGATGCGSAGGLVLGGGAGGIGGIGNLVVGGSKRLVHAMDAGCGSEGPDQKRALLDHLLYQKAGLMSANPQMYAAGLSSVPAPTGAVSLTSALRPNLGLVSMPHHHQANTNTTGGGGGPNHFNTAAGGGLPAIMSKHMDTMGQHAAVPNHPHYQHHQLQQQHNTNNGMNNYMSQGATNHHHHHHHHHHVPNNASNQGGAGAGGQPHHQQYPTSTSTADIVNAAISALRYAS